MANYCIYSPLWCLFSLYSLNSVTIHPFTGSTVALYAPEGLKKKRRFLLEENSLGPCGH
jgi:hypothetical protein